MMKTVHFAMTGKYLGFISVREQIVPITEKRFITVTVTAETADEAMVKALTPELADHITINESMPNTVEVGKSAEGMVDQDIIDFVNDNLDILILPDDMELIPASLEFDEVNAPEPDEL